jgi:hypothetical protein
MERFGYRTLQEEGADFSAELLKLARLAGPKDLTP